jgi:GBP family porin
VETIVNLLKATSALAVALISPLAAAQSNVAVYGIVDACMVAADGIAGARTQINSGCAYGSRLGFRGQEDLGGGMKADFILESGFNIDTGVLGQGGRLFGRKALLGLSGGYGHVQIGRDYAPTFYLVRPVDPFRLGLGTASSMISTAARPDGVGRNDNAIVYTSPKLNGFSVKSEYALGEATATSTTTRDSKGILVSYESGGLLAGAAYNTLANASNTANDRIATIGASYQLGSIQPAILYQVGKWEGTRSLAAPAVANSFFSRDYTSMMLGVTIGLGKGSNLIGTYKSYNDKTVRNFDASQVTVGYKYQLSKRTELYTAYTRLTNKNNAAYGLVDATTTYAPSGAGTDPSALYVGVTHNF